jgi:hypothetical protein
MAERTFTRDQAADVVQARFTLERLEEQRQRLDERPVAQIVEPTAPACRLGEDRVDRERLGLGQARGHGRSLR